MEKKLNLDIKFIRGFKRGMDKSDRCFLFVLVTGIAILPISTKNFDLHFDSKSNQNMSNLI